MPAPFILIENGAPHVVDTLPDPEPNRLAVITQFWKQQHAFDKRFEYSLHVTDLPSFGIVSKILARTIYNPSVDVDCTWTVCGDYDPQRIFTLVTDALKRDDDLIQQWFAARDICKLLKAADSFDRMILAIRCICGEHEIDENVRQYADEVV